MSSVIYYPMLAVIANYLSAISEKQQQNAFYEHDEYYMEEVVIEDTTILNIEHKHNDIANSSTLGVTAMQAIKHPLLAVLFSLFCIITVVISIYLFQFHLFITCRCSATRSL
jgi:hypothetical protein